MGNAEADKELTDILTALYGGYHPFGEGEAADGAPYGSFEVFYNLDGWYWWPCFPGCLPDGDQEGPFDTAFAAYTNAQEEDA